MAESVEILEKITAIKEGMTPTGRKLGVLMEPQGGLYYINYVDEKGGGLPISLTGRWTKSALAHEAIEHYLSEAWGYSDEQATKARRKDYKDKVETRDAKGA